MLRATPQRGNRDYYFGIRSKGYTPLAKVKKRLDAMIVYRTGNPLAPWCYHDLRRTMRTGLGRVGVPEDIAELVINHVKGRIKATYDKGKYRDEIDAALARWADYVMAMVEGRDKKKVLQLTWQDYVKAFVEGRDEKVVPMPMRAA
jgi:hypothetical protein